MGAETKAERNNFFLKKEAKTLTALGARCSNAYRKFSRVSWVFFLRTNSSLPRAFQEISPPTLALFRAWLHFLFWRQFSSVRLARAQMPDRHQGRPLVIYTNHPSWWDPALFMLLSPKLFPGRIGFGPMEAAQLQRYGFFRKLGVFGVAPGPAGATAFLRTARAGLAEPRAIMWMTAEGRFTDARSRPISLRPGIAHLARLVPGAVFVPAALEYVFWNESRPEALIGFGPPITAQGNVNELLAAFTQGLTAAMDQLSADAASRDPARFVTLLNGTAGAGLFYDNWRRAAAWLRLRRYNPRHQAPGP